MKHIKILTSIILAVAWIASYVILPTNENSSLCLQNVEALSQDLEYESGYAVKFKTTTSFGPYANSAGNLYYAVQTAVDCIGTGNIECIPSFNVDIKFSVE